MGLKGVPFVDMVSRYRKLVKLLSTYVSPFVQREELKLPVRFHYLLSNVPTMRLSSGAYSRSKKKSEKNTGYFMDMNFQSIPKDPSQLRWLKFDSNPLDFRFLEEGEDRTGAICVETKDATLSPRKAFTAPEGMVWLSADYSAEELRVAANYSRESVWVDSFLNGRDIHKETAIALWGEDVYNSDYRKMAKIANFALLYGGSSYTLQQKLGLPPAEADAFYEKYQSALPGLTAWKKKMIQTSRRQGFVVNAYGLPRRTSYYYAMGEQKYRNFADRTALNTTVQSAGAIMMRTALVKLVSILKEKYNYFSEKRDVVFRGTIHDSIDFCVRKERAYEFAQDLKKVLLSVSPPSWPVPMEVEFDLGWNWSELFVVEMVDGKFIPKAVSVTEELEPEELDEEDEEDGAELF